MFAQLGDHIFEGLKSPNSLSDNGGVRYGRIALVNGKDALQFTGTDLAEINLSILYSTDFCEPRAEINALRQSMTSAEVLPFIMGDGTVIGKYVITTVDVTGQRYSPSGVLEVASVTMNLLEYAGGDDPEPKGLAVVDSSSAPFSQSAPQIPAAQPIAAPIESPAGGITKSLDEGRSAISKIKDVGRQVQKGTIKLKRGVRSVRQLAEDAKQAYTTAKTKIANTKKILKRAGQLPTSLNGAIKYAENLAKLDNVADTSVLKMNIDAMTSAAEKVTVSATTVIAFSATKEGGN